MAIIDAETPGVEDLIQRIVDLVARHGGQFHDRVRFVERGGNLTVEAPTDISPRTIVVGIPEALLLPVAAFDLRREDDRIVAGDGAAATGAQRDLMALMLELYNQSGKIAAHAAGSLFHLREEAPDLYAALTFSDPAQAQPPGVTGDDLLDHFLDTRTLSIRTGIPGSGARRVLMPLIDFFDHAPRAPGCVLHNGSLVVTRGLPVGDTEACYISYGRYDTHDLLLKYGFLPDNLGFAKSVPFDLELPGGQRVSVMRTGEAMNHDRIPEPLGDIGWILPAAHWDRRASLLTLFYLPLGIEGGSDPARRLLEFLVPPLLGATDPAAAGAVVDLVLETATRKVGEYYSAVERQVTEASIDSTLLSAMIARQRQCMGVSG